MSHVPHMALRFRRTEFLLEVTLYLLHKTLRNFVFYWLSGSIIQYLS
jgi:hypothetical protein